MRKAGEVTVRKRPSDKWEYRFEIEPLDGKRRRKEKGGFLWQKDRTPYTVEQIGQIFDLVPPGHDYHMAFYLTINCGLRIGEALALTWDRIDLKARTLTIVRKSLNKYTKTMSDKLGFKIDTHTGRHTHATLAIESGAKETAVAARLGQKDIKTTRKYIHTTDNMDQEALDCFESALSEDRSDKHPGVKHG